MIIAVLCAAILLSVRFRTRAPWRRLDSKELRRLNRRSENEHREQIHPFE
jgi:hypothetical protein